ncbi:MAG: adenylate/guanylate cyclase domain-containing protein, partial [Pseudomonadota bacterium]|nr:adenylate/guanylate cyclase domain-containing protein [Pseudomonadota bacterium]
MGLGEHAESFVAADIDFDMLPDLTELDLRALGLSLGQSKRLVRAIAKLHSPSRTAQSEAAPERRQLSILFCDLVGSTDIASQLDPEDFRDVIGGYHRACAEVVDRCAGSIVRFQGDGILVLFGYPAAHEDDADRAVQCGLELVSAVASSGAQAGISLAARVGIATGLVVVGERLATQERSILGDAPNLAARLQAEAKPGQVLVDQLTRRMVGERFGFTALGPRTMRGLTRPVWIS